MADIFDLAKSINRRRQQASQGYASGWEDLPMQVMKMMDTRAKEKRVSLKNDSVLLSNLIKGATTEEEIANAKQLANKYAKDSYQHDETKLYGEAINQQFNSKQAAYNQFKSSAEWFDNQLNARPEEEGLDSTDYGLSQINDKTWDGLSNEKFGKPVSKLSDIENIDMMASISKGGSDKFRSTRGWGEWSTVQQGMDKQFLSMIDSDGFDSVAGKYNLSSDVINKINQSFDNDEDKSKALAVIIAESGGDSSAVNYNYGDKVKGRSYFDMSSEELQSISLADIDKRIIELQSMQGGFEVGAQYNFKYNKGKSSNVTLQKQYEDYKQRLDDTLKAHRTGNKISGEEAMAIAMGDFKKTRTTVEAQIRAKLSQLNSQYAKLSKLNVTNIATEGKDVLFQGFEDGKISENSTESDLQKYINEESDKVYRQILAQEERQFLWTGISSDGGSKELGDIIAAGGATTGGATTTSNQITSIEGQANQNKPTNTPPKSIITDISPSKTNIDEKRYSTKDLNKLPELKKANGKFVTTDKDNSLVEWDNVAYIPSLKKNVPILKGKTDMDTYYWDNGWKHLRGQSPSSVMMSEEEYKKEINESKELSKIQKEQFLKDTSRGWKWIKRKLLKSGSIPSGGKIISMNGKEV